MPPPALDGHRQLRRPPFGNDAGDGRRVEQHLAGGQTAAAARLEEQHLRDNTRRFSASAS
jgi:hypothetical protein